MSGDQSGPVELNGTGGAPGGGSGSNGVHVDGTMNGGGTISPGGGGGSDAGGAGGQNAADTGCSDGPSSIIGVGPPSPLTGCYLLIVIGEPHSQDHKDIILQRLVKGFLSWDVLDCHVDLEEELHAITLQALEGEEGKHGERLIQYASENLVTEILIHPQINTFIQCIRNLLSSFTRHRHIIHTGYTFAANGSWVLQDGTFSVIDFMEAFQEHEVQRVLRAYPDTITMDIHCAPVGNWASIQDKTFARLCRIRLNPVDVLSSGSDKLSAFVDYLATMIVPTEISELLESSDVVGNIRFSHPTLYVFPGGQGDAALFGINGFNMLVDGGFSRKSCFWDFVRHLDRLDAVLMTRINNTNIKGISAVVERKNEAHVYPQIGHFFCNIPERKGLLSPDGDKDRDPLLVDLIEEGHQIVTNLKSLNLKAQNCYRDTEPINLYHKVGHGTLDMYVISPAKDSKEVKEFLAKWIAADPKLFTPNNSKEFTFPVQNIISICALLVWTPANPEDNITRILFPGSAPEYKILEGLEKMKNVEFMRHPVCAVKSIAPSISTQVFTKKALKSSSIDKIIPEPILPSKIIKPSEKDNKLLDNKIKMIDNKLADATKSSSEIIDSSGDEAKLEKHMTKSSVATVAAVKVDAGKLKTIKTKATESAKKQDNKTFETSKKLEPDEKKDSSDAGSEKDETDKKPEEDKETKEDESKESKKQESPSIKDETKAIKKISERASRPAVGRSRIDSKPSKVTKTIKKKDDTSKSSPTTPKKTIEPKLTNGVAEKKDDETKKLGGPPKTTKPISTKPGKVSPKSTPAKSAKDANNRKVLEARQRPLTKTVPKKESPAAPEKKESPPKIERKPLSRRPKGTTAGHAVGGSPVKAKKVLKSEKDAVIRKAKLDKNGTTDSSLVSTPSADEAGVAVQKRIIDTSGAVSTVGDDSGSGIDPAQQQHLAELKEEQDAVREIEAVFKRDSEKVTRRELLSEHREIQDSTTEPEEEEEYLIIEKEEQYTEDSINEPESSATKEEEIQKHQRDSEESEKRKRDSLEGTEKADIAKAEGETATVVEIIEGDKDEIEEEAKPEDEETNVDKETIEEVKEQDEGAEKLSPKHKQELAEEVQDIIASAKEIAKSKMETSMDGLKTEEISSISPDEKISSTKKTSDTRDENEPGVAPKEHIEPPHESHHEERVSATGESGATTTAPTLPEDERIPLDEIKEDLVIEEKHIKEETKEVEVVPPPPTVYEPLERPTPAKMQFSAQQAHMRDVVKTPDEVADLPMHEEADFEEYSEDKDKEAEKERDIKEKPQVAESAQKETEEKKPEKTEKVVTDKSAESDKQCDTVKDVKEEVQEIVAKVEKDIKVESPPKQETLSTSTKDKIDEVDVLKDLESQIIPKEAEVKEKEEPAKSPDTMPEAVETSDEDRKSVHEEEIVPTKVDSKIPIPGEPSVLDAIWEAPAKAEEKLEELKQIIDDKTKETTSSLVAMKDEMVKDLVEFKEDVIEKAKTEIVDVDKKLVGSITDLGKDAEKAVLTKAEEVVQEIAAKGTTVSNDLQTKAEQLDDKIAAEVESVKNEVDQVVTKADDVLAKIADEKKELEKMAKDITDEVTEKIEETKKQLDDEINKTVELAQEKAKSGISSFLGGITDGLKSGIEKIADKVESKIKDKTDQMESKLQEVTDKIEELKGKEISAEIVPAAESADSFGRSYTQELRETHITTLDSPISDADKLQDIKTIVNIPQHIDEDKELTEIEDSKQAAGSYILAEVKYSSFEDANLRDIKEEEDEDRDTPPQKGDKKSITPKLEPVVQPPRARTPEDVAKIVANVAEVLKSDKDLEEIIPGFDPVELERKLSQGAPRDEDVGTVQRMLVTTSSEDGGEEIDICPPGTITFSKSPTPEPQISGKTTPDIRLDEQAVEQKTVTEKTDKPKLPEVQQQTDKTSPASSGKSSPDLKTSPTSIEEKEKHELPEKAVVVDTKKAPEKELDNRKESLAEQYDLIDDSRRESAISNFSERDYTKDESSFLDDRDSSRAHSISSHISDIKEDAADAKLITDFQKDFDEVGKQKDDVFAKKVEELSSPESVTSQKTISEKVTTDEKIKPATTETVDDEKKSQLDAVKLQVEPEAKEISRPESATSQVSDKASSEEKRPESAISHVSDKALTDKSEDKPEIKETSRPESVASHVSEKAVSEKSEDKVAPKEASRPESAASHVSEKAASEKTEEKIASKEVSRPESAVSNVSDKASTDKPEDKPEVKEVSRPESVASHASEKAASEKSDDKVASKEASRPESAASHVSEKAPSEKPDEKVASKEASRPDSAVSHVSDKAPTDKIDDKSAYKEASRPESAASHVSEKAVSEKSEEKVASKEASRPESVASHVSDKTSTSKPEDKPEVKEISRPESAAYHVSEKQSSEKSEDKIASQEVSRPESAVSGTTDDKLNVKESSRPESAASNVSEKSPIESLDKPADKEASRPESVVSHGSGKAEAKPDSGATSRPESAASHVSEKPSTDKAENILEVTEVSRPESVSSQASEKVLPDDKFDAKEKAESGDKTVSKEISRPESVASHMSEKSEEKVSAKETSRPESVASHVSEKASTGEPADIKETARPESVVSHISEKAPSDKTEEKAGATDGSRPESAASHGSGKTPTGKSEDKSTIESHSRPESATSHTSEKTTLDKSGSKSVESAQSRPESVVSHVSEKGDDKLTEPHDTSRPLSAASDKSPLEEISETTKTEEPIKEESKEQSRPESAGSKGTDEAKATSRPESAASHVSEKEIATKTKMDVAKTDSIAVKPVSEQKTEQKELSRPESVASHASDKEKSESTVGTKASEPESKETEISRPDSATSHISDGAKKDEKISSRPESAASHISDKLVEDKKSEGKDPLDKERSMSVISSTSDKAAVSEKDASRPTSAASHTSEQGPGKVEADKEKTPSAPESEKSKSRPASEASHVSESESAPKEDKLLSRPESAASHGSEKERKTDEKEPSRSESAASHGSEKPSTTDIKSTDTIVNGEFSRPESPASCSSDKVLPSKEPESKSVEKDLARQDSAASYHGEPIPGEKTFSRPESPASAGEEEQDKLAPSSEKKSDEAADKKSEQVSDIKSAETEKYCSRPESPASCGDASELPKAASEDSSFPEKDLARQDSTASYHGEPIPNEKQFSRPDSPASCASDAAVPPQGTVDSKVTSRPESVVSEKAVGKDISRPESAASQMSEKDVAASKSPIAPTTESPTVTQQQKLVESLSRRESATKEDRPSSALSDHAEEQEEKVYKKESRSKSLSAVMSSTTQKITYEGSALGALEELASSRDDLHVGKTPRESITDIVKEKDQKIESFTLPLSGEVQFPIEDKRTVSDFPMYETTEDSPDGTDHILPGMDRLLKESCDSMKEIEKLSTNVISMIKQTEEKGEPSKAEEKTSSMAFPFFESGKSTPLSTEKDKSHTSSIKSVSPHEKDSLEGSSASLNTFIEKDSLSENTTKQVTIKMSAIEESNLKTSTTTGITTGKTESSDLLGGVKTPPTAPISPNVVKEEFSLDETTTAVSSISSSNQMVKQHKEDASGISTPKESVPSGKSSPGLASVQTGSTDSASKSINLGHSSGIETSDSSPKPTSPFPKVIDTLKTDEIKTSSGMSTPDMTRTSTPDMVDSQIERVPDEKTISKTATIDPTTIGEMTAVDNSTKTAADTKKDDTSSAADSMSTSSVTTTTTAKIVKETVKTPGTLTLTTTEDRSLTEEYDDKDILSPRSDISSGQASRIVAAWHDEDVPGSPMSVTSQAPQSPSTKYTYDYDLQHSSSGVSKKSDIEIDDSQDEIPPQYDSEEVKSAITIASAYKPDPMSTSFYGQLPDVSDTAVTKSVPIPITTSGKAFSKTYMEYASSGDSSIDSSQHKTTRDSKYLDDADLDFEKTFTKSDQVDLMTTSMHFSSEKEFMAATSIAPSGATTVADGSKKELDFTASGLPSSVSPQQAQTTVASTTQSGTSTSSTSSTGQPQPNKDKDPFAVWGKPLGLPSPAPLNDDNMRTTPKKERRMIISKTRLNNEKNLRKRSESPIKAAKKPAPVYVDLSYVPHHGNSYYANVEFFKRVRARYYVFSGTEPSREVYNALLEAKQTWEDKDLEVTIIPTYDTDVLGYWVSENEDLLAKYHIDLSPSAARCTINLQDHETSCSAYRLEF
ncbi:microtubule-associated protein futsch [Malaya genurostris]|uniref:microtubule-associated protein futsch n=1 Tax=Malaya genurostris TaxID=325434 RepID=UPI0026F3F113|nr:microtubule-associated protein futsch [Malaya genurostris]